MTLSDLYGQLFGKSSIQDGDVISMAEHGRIGDISTGQGFKYVGILNASGSLVSEFGGTGSALATVTAVQGPAGTVPWLMTLATLSVVTQPGAGALATVTAQQGSAGVSPWLVTMGTLSVTQAGIWSVNALASIPGTSNINIASSDIPLGGGSQYNNGDTVGVPIGNVMMWRQSGDNTVQSAADDNPLPVSVSTSLTIQSLPTLSVHQGSSPWITSNAGGSLTAYQGSAPWSVLATGSNFLTIQSLPTLSVFQGTSPWNVQNAGGSLSAYQAGDWNIMASIPAPIYDGGANKTLKSAMVSLSSTGSVVSAVVSKKIKAYAIKLICSATLSIGFRDGASTMLEGSQLIVPSGGFVESVNPPSYLFTTSAGNSLDLVISGTGTAAGRVSYWDDDAA